MSSLLDLLSSAECWEKYYKYKTSLACPKQFAAELREFIDNKAYLTVCKNIFEGKPFPLPRREEISKQSTSKKRVIYIYPRCENIVLKLLTYLMLRKYDGCFSDGLWSFRPERSAQRAIARLSSVNGIKEMYSYKADISNYFNSVDVSRLLPKLESIIGEDRLLFGFLRSLLTETRVIKDGKEFSEQKGIMAGTPTAAFFANVYLREIDRHFADEGIPYARYSDDIILFGRSREETEAHAEYVRSRLIGEGLALNPEKERFSAPDEGWVFLGLFYHRGIIDIAPASVEKLKGKMRRKSRALMRWQARKGAGGEQAAKAFIKVFERKLFESPSDNDLSWTMWYFPTINTADSLQVIDRYAQECLRWMISGKRTKSRFNVRYEQLRQLGLRSLVNEYYSHRKRS